MTKRFITAFQFLTAIPLFKATTFSGEELAKSMAAFPLVGAALGLIVLVFHYAIGIHLPPMLEGAAIVAIFGWATGGFHLDGLADTVDGLAGGWTVERSLEIMKDSRVGALGASALAVTVLLRASGYGYLPGYYLPMALLAAPAVSRGAAVFVAYKSKYARPEAGLGTPYTEHLDDNTVLIALVLSATISVLCGMPGIIAAMTTFIFAFWMKTRFHKKLGGITGDVLGFTQQISEIVYLITLHVMI